MPLKSNSKDLIRLTTTAMALAVIVMVLIWATAVFAPTQRYLNEVNPKWVRFWFLTIIVALYWVNIYWHARKRLGFWIVFLAALLVHVIVVGFIFYSSAGLLPLIFAVVAETGLLGIAEYRLLGIGPASRRN